VDGNFVAEHEGIELFTIGQRKGLPGGSPQPRYVVDLDPETNRVIVGAVEDLVCEEFEVDRCNWIDRSIAEEREVTVKIRYSHPGTAATVTLLENERARISLHEPQRAVTPGQAAVFYDDDLVLGGGWICRHGAAVPV
jgi:tRNA-specific 2-thiouridylase